MDALRFAFSSLPWKPSKPGPMMMPHFHPPKKHVLPVRRTSPLDTSCSFHVQRDRNQQKNQSKTATLSHPLLLTTDSSDGPETNAEGKRTLQFILSSQHSAGRPCNRRVTAQRRSQGHGKTDDPKQERTRYQLMLLGAS